MWCQPCRNERKSAWTERRLARARWYHAVVLASGCHTRVFRDASCGSCNSYAGDHLRKCKRAIRLVSELSAGLFFRSRSIFLSTSIFRFLSSSLSMKMCWAGDGCFSAIYRVLHSSRKEVWCTECMSIHGVDIAPSYDINLLYNVKETRSTRVCVCVSVCTWIGIKRKHTRARTPMHMLAHTHACPNAHTAHGEMSLLASTQPVPTA